MNFLCPACRTPLPTAAPAVVSCTQCGVEVDLTRVDTAPGQAKLWPEVDLSGESLGSFKLLSRAGSGGMGTVYVAEGLAGRCAVKVLSPQMAADPQLRERFRREAQALRQVLHKGIVRIIDEGTQSGFCWYAMEHVDGPDLRSRIAQGPLQPNEVEVLARELLDALAAVHDAQLVHRDLKPANILLSPAGARLCDFGIARFDGATTLTESAALLGSLRYMAPEQRAGQTSPKSDLYSLGLVLHEALAKALPGEAELPSSTPRRLRRLIEALLQTAPRLRPADAHDAARLIALPKPGRVPAAVLVSASVLGMSAFAAWSIIGTQVKPPAPHVAPRPKPQPVAVAALIDAGSAEAPTDAGALAEATVFDAGTPVVAQAPAAPRTELATLSVNGGLTEAAVRRVLDGHRLELAKCYEQELGRNPELAGDITLEFTVKAPGTAGRTPPVLRAILGGGKMKKSKIAEPPEGKPQAEEPPDTLEAPGPKSPPVKATAPGFGAADSLGLVSQTLNDKLMIVCVLDRIPRWRFPSPKGTATVTATWSFAPSGGQPLAKPQATPKPRRFNTIDAAGTGTGTEKPTKK